MTKKPDQKTTSRDSRAGKGFDPFALAASVLAVATMLAACGGGSSSTADNTRSLSGTALTGAALSGATVTVTDKAGTVCGTATTGSNGTWTLASWGTCTDAPFLIQVSGNDSNGVYKNYLSMAMAEDVRTASQAGNSVNVSQLTDAALKVALNNDTPLVATPAALTALTPAQLQTASAQVLALLPASVVPADVDASKDIRVMAVTAGSGQGLDKVLDRVPHVEVNTTQKGIVATVISDAGTTAVVGGTLASAAGKAAISPVPAGNTVVGVVTTASKSSNATELAAITPQTSAGAEIQALIAQLDGLWKTSVPASGALSASYADGCYLNNGATKQLNIDRRDGKYDWTVEQAKSALQYKVGSTRSNFKLLNVTPTSDGKTKTARVSYDIAYTDGTKALATEHTLVWGDSTDSCSANGLATTLAENRKAWRFVADDAPSRQVSVTVEAHNRLTYTSSITDGTLGKTSTGTTIAPDLQNALYFYISDPRSLGYTYAIVTGPALPSNGLKFVFAKVFNSPELAGKTGNYLNDTTIYEAARLCSSGSGTSQSWDAATANCTVNGVSGYFWRLTDSTINTVLTGNDVYTFKLYKGDGWKTVNGHAGVTPDLTYTDTLIAKPFTSSFVEDNYPQATLANGDLSKWLSASKGGGDQTVSGTLKAAASPANAKPRAFTSLWHYSQGRSTAATYWPQYRKNDRTYISGTATVFSGLVKGKSADMLQLDYTEAGIATYDRNGHVVETVYSFK